MIFELSKQLTVVSAIKSLLLLLQVHFTVCIILCTACGRFDVSFMLCEMVKCSIICIY